MSEPFVRKIEFIIPGFANSPDVTVTATEVDGTLVFEIDVESDSQLTADLRGLFFNVNYDDKLDGLGFDGSDVTGSDTEDVINLGNGVNMHAAASPFDAGVKFGRAGVRKADDIQSTSFILSNTANNLTLDDIANVEFGVRLTSIGVPEGERIESSKQTVIAPAAPDAVNDDYAIFEDGQAGLDSPSHVPVGTVFQVLDNDTDADSDTLTIVDLHQAAHGTVEIIDGDDADTLIGDALLYTPDADYSGTDSFEYLISDNNGGTDFAEVNVVIEAVADAPDLSYEIIAGDNVNEIIVRVTATQTDADSSEFIDRIVLSGIPAGVIVDEDGYNPVDEPDQIVKDFLLTLPLDQDTDFELGITAFSKETSNGDEESTSMNVPIVMETNQISENVTFQATDQSIWTSGDEFVFEDHRFLGIDASASGGDGGLISTDWSYDVKAGFQSDLVFEGGDIDADIPWQFDFDTFYNKTTDVLVIETYAEILNGGFFQTDGPSLEYMLDFIFNYDVFVDVDIEIDFALAEIDEDLFTINSNNDFQTNIIDFDSDTSDPLNFTLPDPLGSIDVTLAWPNLEVSGTQTSLGIYEGDGFSNNALNVNLDIDQAFADVFFGGVNPFNLNVDLTVAGGTLELLDADVAAGLNFLQDFLLTAGNIDAILEFEDGSSQIFTFGDELIFNDASDIDAGGDGDGLVEFEVVLDLVNSTLANDTDLGFNVGWNLDLFQGGWWYDIAVYDDSGSWGPAVDLGEDQIPVADIDVFSEIVGVAFGVENFDIFA